MTYTIIKKTPSQHRAQADKNRQTYEQHEQKSTWYRNYKSKCTQEHRAMTPPLPADYPEPEPLFPLKRNSDNLPLHKSFKDIKGFRFNPKFSSSESVTLSPRSLNSERSDMDMSLLGERAAKIHSSITDLSTVNRANVRQFRENAIKKQLGELKLRRGRLILKMESAKQENDEDELNGDDFWDREIAKRRKKSLQAHFKIVPRGLYESVTGTPELARMPIEQRREAVFRDLKETSALKDDEPVCANVQNSVEVNERVVQKSHFDKFFARQVYLKQKVNRVIKQIAYIKERQRLRAVRRLINLEIVTYHRKASVIAELKRKSVAIQELVGLRFDFTSSSEPRIQKVDLHQIIKENLLQRERKAIVCKEIRSRHRQIEVKAHAAQVIQTHGLKIKLMSELRQFFLKRKLTKLGGATTSKSSNLDLVLRRVRRKIIERSRLMRAARKLSVSFRQIGRTRLLKKQINTVIKTHYRKSLVVKEIKSKGQITRNLQNELRGRQSWHHNREQLRGGQRDSFAGRSQKTDQTQNKSVANDHFSHQASWEMLFTKEMRQRGLKHKMQRDLLMRFRTVDLKAKLCVDVLQHAKTKTHRRQVLSVIRQRALKSKLNQEIHEQKWRLKEAEPEMELFTTFILKDKYSAIKKTRRLKREINKQIEKRGLENRQVTEARRNKAVVLRQIKKKEHWMLNTRTRFQRIRQKSLKAKVVAQITIMGQKMRVNEQIKKRNHSILFKNQRSSQRKEMNFVDDEKKTEFVNLDDVSTEAPVDPPTKTRFSTYAEFKEMWDDLKQKNQLHEEIRKREELRLKTEVHKRKSIVIMELKMRVAKVKCMRAIRTRAQARMNHMAVCQEINQRRNLGRCMQDIKSGSYYLTHVSMLVKSHSLMIIKQQKRKRNVNSVIRQAGRKVELNREILARQAQCNQKALVIAEIKLRFGTAKVCAEIRLRAKQRADSMKWHKAALQELVQRFRHRELTKEIKTRQKAIFWKKSTCTIIKQGGNKVLVNNEIRAIAKQKYLKKQINIMIRQGGLKSSVQKEIRQIRAIMELKEQQTLKTKVNIAIRQLAKAHTGERRVSSVLKQTALKAKCNKAIRAKEFLLWPVMSQQQVPSQVQIKEQCESHQQIKERGSHQQIKELPGRKSIDFDDKDSVYGDTVSETGIAVMKLVECLTKARKLKDQQDREIRALSAVVAQQKADFAALNMRLVEDKNRLYQKLDDLKEENKILTELLSKKEQEELVKAFQKAQHKEIKRRVYTQKQNAAQLCQEMKVLHKSATTGTKTQRRQFLESSRFTQTFF